VYRDPASVSRFVSGAGLPHAYFIESLTPKIVGHLLETQIVGHTGLPHA